MVSFKKLSGLSNDCYRVESAHAAANPNVVFYRKFLTKTADRQMEAVIFKNASEKSGGPVCLYQCERFRIETFFKGRPLSIWELRSPCLARLIMQKICDFHFNSDVSTKVA
jgi:hypothetical protein